MFKLRGIRKLIVLLTFVVCILLAGRYLFLPRIFPLRYQQTVLQMAAEFQIKPSLVYGVMFTESKLRADAVSAKNAKGLMQITEGTGEWAAGRLGITDYDNNALFEPEINIRMGCWYLNNLNKQFNGNWDTTFAAYNAGSGNVSKWLQTPEYSEDGITLIAIPFEETKNYVKRVKFAQRIYNWLYQLD